MTPHIKPPIASVITDEQVAAGSRQLMTQEGAKYAVAMAVSVTRFREVSVSSPQPCIQTNLTPMSRRENQ